MDGQDLKTLIGKKLYITCSFNGKTVFYTGIIVKLNDSSVLILDKFNNEVLINLGSILKVEVFSNADR